MNPIERITVICRDTFGKVFLQMGENSADLFVQLLEGSFAVIGSSAQLDAFTADYGDSGKIVTVENTFSTASPGRIFRIGLIAPVAQWTE